MRLTFAELHALISCATAGAGVTMRVDGKAVQNAQDIRRALRNQKQHLQGKVEQINRALDLIDSHYGMED